MKIALFCSPSHIVPPQAGKIFAPWLITGQICEAMMKRGHQVTLYAANESITSATLASHGIAAADTYADGRQDGRRVRFYDNLLLSYLYRQALTGAFDIIHIHQPLNRSLPFAQLVSTPTLITLHSPLADSYIFSSLKKERQIKFVPISNHQRSTMPGIQYTETIYNGVDTNVYKFQPKAGDYLFITGRIVPEKGFHTAIEVAKKAGQKLIIAGGLDPHNLTAWTYWKERIEPTIDGQQIQFLGALGREELIKLYQGAKALLFPIEWDEPFGLVMIESMACGTPVIAFNHGSVPEVVKDGETGFIVDNPQEMGEAIKNLEYIKRRDCRRRVEQLFSLQIMIDHYEKLYASSLC